MPNIATNVQKRIDFLRAINRKSLEVEEAKMGEKMARDLRRLRESELRNLLKLARGGK